MYEDTLQVSRFSMFQVSSFNDLYSTWLWRAGIPDFFIHMVDDGP